MLFSCGGSVKPNVFAVAVTVYSVVIDKIPFALLPVYGNPRAVGYLAEYNGAYIRSFADIQPPALGDGGRVRNGARLRECQTEVFRD